MPRTRSLAWSELKIGVLTVVALVITAVTIFLLTGSRGLFWQRYPLKTRFGDVAGLKPGSPVRLAGVEVGSVTAVELTGDKVDVTFEVNKKYRSRITDRSTAALGSISLLGEYAVDVKPASSGTPIADGEYVPAAPAAAQLADVTQSVNQGVQKISALLDDVRAGRGTVGKLITDEQLYAEMNRFVASANDVTRTIRQGRGSLLHARPGPDGTVEVGGRVTYVEKLELAHG